MQTPALLRIKRIAFLRRHLQSYKPLNMVQFFWPTLHNLSHFVENAEMMKTRNKTAEQHRKLGENEPCRSILGNGHAI